MSFRAELTAQINREHEHEQANVLAPGGLPVSYEAITPAWLTSVMCKGIAGAEVLSHRLDTPDQGMTNRRRIYLTYNQAGVAAGLPESVFCKSTFELSTRLLVAGSGLTQGEALFFRDYAHELDIPAPKCYYAEFDAVSHNCLIVMDDLALQGAEFCKYDTPVTRARAESQMAFLAGLHGKYYDGAAANAPGLPTFEDIFHNIDRWLDMQAHTDSGCLNSEEVIPARLYRRSAEMWPATLKSAAMHGTLPRTLTHNDVHLKNWYITADDQMVLGDWQCFGRGHWSRDFAYTIGTSLKIEDRRLWERDLLRLYLEKFRAAGGPVIPFDDAWTYYRRQLFSSLAWWTMTLAEGSTHVRSGTLEFIGRTATAIDDLDALESFD